MSKTMRLYQYKFVHILVVWIIGIGEALLIARFVARLLAARPDNPVIWTLYTLTKPPVMLLERLDIHQPHFGAILEVSTFVLAISVPIVGYGLWRIFGTHRATPFRDRTS